MTLQTFQHSTWYNALTISERLASLRARADAGNSDSVLDRDLAMQRLQTWRSQSPFNDDAYFHQRLALDNINEAELHRLLGEPVEAIHARSLSVPQWLLELATAFSRATSFSPDGVLRPQTPCGCEIDGFLNIIAPLVHQSCERLSQAVHALSQTRSRLPFDPDTIEAILFANLPAQLFMLLSRTLTLELNVARLEGRLEGQTPEERFKSFSNQLRSRDTALAILEEYPVLARQLTVHIDNWLNFSLEVLHHLCADWEAICATFSPEHDPGVLVKIVRSGDSHRGGRAVVVATFSNDFQLVYKPKSMAVDAHFQELLSWLNERGVQVAFRTLRILDRETYGWCEYVAARSCADADAVARFYERQGGYLALLYALEATDFHFENLIAAGEDPVLVDLESLFHPRIEGVDLKQGSGMASSLMVYSVLRVGLLPQRIWFNDENEGIDLSGLGAAAGQITPQALPYWEAAGTDMMRLKHKRVALPGAQNRPTIMGNEVNALDYSTAIVRGFTAVYQLLREHRDELLAADGPLTRFARDEVRLIVRPTRTYSLMMHESMHPDVLRNALERDWLFDRLWIGVKHRAYLADIIPSECRDLQRGDVPMFTTCPDTRDIWNSTGERLPDFLDEPGLALVQRRIQQLSADDLLKQLWFINASLATLSTGTDQARWATYRLTEPTMLAERDQLIAAARAIGDRLETLALRDESDVSWIGLTFINERHWTLLPLGFDLYNGLPGIALFLAYLGTITREERYTELAGATVRMLQRNIETFKSSVRSVGAFDGAGGWIYTLTHLSVLWEQPALLAEAEAVVELLPALIEQDSALDIIGGVAGCIGSLVCLYRHAPSDRLLAVARECGNKLVAGAQPMAQGIGWVTPMSSKPLAGFSHGAAGIAWALLELADITKEERFKTAAIRAFAYERSLFSFARGNWPGLREPDPEGTPEATNNNFMVAWCHGAPGIGMGRLRSLRHVDDEATRAEIDVALRTTLAEGFGHNHSLCHGDMGNIELLLLASQTLDEPQWHAQLKRMTAIILDSINENGWLCGVPLGVESPGLMTGLAGIGYELLRLAEPMRVPSVLALEPPTPAQNDGGANARIIR